MSRKFLLCSIVLLQSMSMPLSAKDKQKSKNSGRNAKVELKIKSKTPFDTEFSREFMSDIVGNSLSYLVDISKNLKKHPALFSCIAGGLLGKKLYQKELSNYYQKVGEFINTHRGFVLLTGVGALLAAYANKDFLLQKIAEDADDSGTSPSTEGKDPEIMNMHDFSKSSVRIYRPGEIKIGFNDVAGLETAKEELSDIVMFLKDPELFEQIGAKTPKGVLLSGEPGNGKTLLARALAGEAECPFLYVSGSEFIQAIVGIGASRVRNLFAIARELAPCIVFIDEVDAIGRKRGVHGFGGDTELAQTLNQLLVEMDGFEQQKHPIIVLGATNRADVLDSALMRPGRFDRKIEVTSPFIHDRFKILSLHMKNIKIAPDLDIFKIARGTPGYSGADLAHLVNEAAILALREGKKVVSMIHFDQARDNINLGRESKGMEISQTEYWHTAVHEAGHALMLVYQEFCEPLHKVTIVPRNGILGVTFAMSLHEQYSKYIEHFKAQIVFCLGGSVAEEIMYGGRGAGAHSDLQKARHLATQMVMRYGMTDEFKDITFERYINDEVHLPDELAAKLQQEVSNIIHECRQIAYDIIMNHKDKLEKLVQMLLENGTVYGSDVYKLCEMPEPDIEYSLTV